MSKKKDKKEAPLFVPVLAAKDIDHKPAPEGKAFKIVQVVQHADLRCMFDGFLAVLKRQKMTFADLPIGHTVIFLNTDRNYIKVVMGNGTNEPIIACHRFPKGKRLPAEAVMDLAVAFRKPQQIDAKEAIVQALVSHERRKSREVRQLPSGRQSTERPA